MVLRLQELLKRRLGLAHRGLAGVPVGAQLNEVHVIARNVAERVNGLLGRADILLHLGTDGFALGDALFRALQQLFPLLAHRQLRVCEQALLLGLLRNERREGGHDRKARRARTGGMLRPGLASHILPQSFGERPMPRGAVRGYQYITS